MTLATTSPCLTTRCTYTPSLRLKDGRRMTYHCYRQPNKLSRSHRATSFVFAFPEFIRGLKRSDRIGNNIYWSSYVHTNSSPRPARRFCTNLVLLLCSSLRLFFDNPSILIHRSSSFNARLSRVCSAPSSLFGHSVTHGSLDTQTSEDYEIEGKKRRKRDSKHASEDVEKESRKKKRRISWERKGEVPDEPLEGVVAKRAGKLPTARTEKRMRSKPPRLSSGLVSLLQVEHTLHTSPRKAFSFSSSTSSASVSSSSSSSCSLEDSVKDTSLPLHEKRPERIPSSSPHNNLLSPSSSVSSFFAQTAGATSLTEDERTALIETIQQNRIKASMNFSEGGSRTGVGKGQAAEGGEEDSSLLLPVPIGPAYVNTPYGGWGQLRVTGGRHRGRRLLMPRTPVSGAVRPMMSKVKEAVFSMLESMGILQPKDKHPLRVLDLFSGSGALAIEALSRGEDSSTVLLVDSSLDCCEAAAVNLRYCEMTERSRVIRASVEEFLLAPHRFFPLHDFPRFLFRQANRMKEAQTLHASLSLDEPTEMGRSYQREDMDELDRRRSSEDSTRSSGVQRMIEKLRDDILEKEYEYRGDTKKEKKRVVSTHLFDLVLMTPPYTTVVYKDLIQLLLNCSVIRDDSLVVIEYPKEIGCLPRLIRSETTSAALIGLRNRLYGRTCVGVYVKQKVYLTPRKKEFTSLQPRETGRQGQRSQENTDLTDCMQALNGEEMKTDSGSNRRVLEERDVPAKDEKEYDGKQYKRKNITHLNETLLPETSYWYGQEKPSEFVPLGLHRKQLLSEGWIERRGVERKNE